MHIDCVQQPVAFRFRYWCVTSENITYSQSTCRRAAWNWLVDSLIKLEVLIFKVLNQRLSPGKVFYPTYGSLIKCTQVMVTTTAGDVYLVCPAEGQNLWDFCVFADVKQRNVISSRNTSHTSNLFLLNNSYFLIMLLFLPGSGQTYEYCRNTIIWLWPLQSSSSFNQLSFL